MWNNLSSKLKWAITAIGGGALSYLGKLAAEWAVDQGILVQSFNFIISILNILIYFPLIGFGMLLAIFWEYIFFWVRKYDNAWLMHDDFEAWQAACLWVGEEPTSSIQQKSKPYAILELLEKDIRSKKIKGKPPHDHANPMWYKITRADLREYIKHKGKKSKFPF